MTTAVTTGNLVPTDVIDVLLSQHEEIRRGLAALAAAPDAERDGAVRDLAVLIEVHEDMEARLVHPLAEQGLPDGAAVAHARVVEENRADELLSQLITLGAADARFPAVFAEFRAVMLDHLRQEEQQEFTPLRARLPHEHLVELGVRARESRLWL